ncbi:MAG: ATP-binding cassette domain-containing protein [Chloroflexi bacterium AL-W]|nr:ATP-binding cassette domain-containing protein [Chloroflexi bacterium AL-W]
MTDYTIIAEDLVKTYDKRFNAVDGVSFQVESGEIFGFLGPNGAGKSTTVLMLTTLGLPTAGRATVGGFDVVTQAQQVRRIAGVALQEIGLDPLMKSLELLILQGQLFGLSKKQSTNRAHELLELVKLTEFTERPVGKYSGGMRRRLDLALALVHEPRVLFLDEPTTGLDPSSRRDVWSEVRRLNRDKGITIFLTTQYLEEADELADRVAIIDKGKIAAEGKPSDLKSAIGTESINVTFDSVETAQQAENELKDQVKRTQLDRRTLRLYLPDAASAVSGVVSRLEQAGIKALSITLSQPTLDDVFLQVTGQNFEQNESPIVPQTETA